MSSPSSSSSVRVLGQVKWFNLKAGYGFLSVKEPVIPGDTLVTTADVFVHHTAIKLKKEQFRYLVQDEEVEFDISTSQNDNHKFQALNVKAPQNSLNPLTCERRNLERYQNQGNGGEGQFFRPPPITGGNGFKKGFRQQQQQNTEEWLITKRKTRQ
jgi:cold shock CspA family protein